MPTHLVRVGNIARSIRAKMVLPGQAILPTLPAAAVAAEDHGTTT
jgi:hypothetical protein